MSKVYEPKFNYILNDLALSILITKNLYSKDATYDDKRELENQIELIKKENKQLKDNWNKLKECLKDVMNSCDADDKEFVETILDIMQEIEGSDSNDRYSN